MPRLSLQAKDETLRRRAARLQNQIAAVGEQLRKQDTRRKIVAGALALNHIAQHPEDEFSRQMRVLLSKFVEERDQHLWPDVTYEPRPPKPPKGKAKEAFKRSP